MTWRHWDRILGVSATLVAVAALVNFGKGDRETILWIVAALLHCIDAIVLREKL